MTLHRPSGLPATVVIVGVVSLLNDFASEMVVPLIPLLLATVLAAGPVALGAIEGVADAVSNLLKLWAGRHSDLYGRRRKTYAVAGYALSNLVRPLVAVAGSWLFILTVRVVDRIGKGVRTAPRDALIADAIAEGSAGRAYGFTRALDHTGAVLGALAAAAIVHWGTERLDVVIALSAVPGLAAVLLFGFAVKEPARPRLTIEQIPPLRWSALDPPARRYLFVITLFMLGRIPETFVLLRGHELGMGVVELLLLWAAMHVVKAAVSEQAGHLADRLGRRAGTHECRGRHDSREGGGRAASGTAAEDAVSGRRPLILSGWTVYAATLLTLAFVREPPMLWAGSLALGIYFGLTEGAERALVRDLAAPAERGTAFGWFHMLVGMAAIPAGLLLGGLWAYAGVQIAFVLSAAVAVIAVIAFWRYVR